MTLSHHSINIVIPVLNEAACLPVLLSQLAGYRVLVVDGGSQDDSVAVAQRYGAQVFTTHAGRVHQLALGARHTHSDWLLFLHADSRLSQDWQEVLAAFIARGDYPLAVFRFQLDDTSRAARFLEKLVAWRCRRWALPYGDQGLLIHRNAYLAAGGFAEIPLMEDVALIKKFSRNQICLLDTPLTTSGARFRRRGYFLQSLRNVIFLGLYLLGVSPERLARFY